MAIQLVDGKLDELLLTKDYAVVVHCVTCSNDWVSDTSKELKELYPGAFEVDSKTGKGSEQKLGRFSRYKDDGLLIINAYTQLKHIDSINICQLDYVALRDVFKRIYKASVGESFKGKKILTTVESMTASGGNWKILEGVLNTIFVDSDIYIIRGTVPAITVDETTRLAEEEDSINSEINDDKDLTKSEAVVLSHAV